MDGEMFGVFEENKRKKVDYWTAQIWESVQQNTDAIMGKMTWRRRRALCR